MKETNGNIYSVYILTCEENGKKYVGVTSRNPKKRWGSGHGYAKQPAIYKDIKKYGWNKFRKEIVFVTKSQTDAAKEERRLIELLGTCSFDKGYNMTKGGEVLGGDYWLDSTRKLRSESKKGEKNPQFHKRSPLAGIKVSEETKRKQSIAKKKLFESDEVRERNKIQLEEARRHFNPTEKWKKELIEMMREKRAKKCLCVTTGKMYESARSAAKETGLSFSTVARLCRTGKESDKTGIILRFQYVE